MSIQREPLILGQAVVIISDRTEMKPFRATVTNVGRKYATVTRGGGQSTYEFDMETRNFRDKNYPRMYVLRTVEEHDEAVKAADLRIVLAKHGVRFDRAITSDKLVAILAIVDDA